MRSNVHKRCDCPSRSQAKCSHGWHFAWQHKGKHHRLSLDKHCDRHVDSKTEASELASELRKQIRAGKFGAPIAVNDMTVQQLSDVYCDRYVKVTRPLSADDFTSGLRVVCNTVLPRPTGGTLAFGQWVLSDVVTDTIERFREARMKKGTKSGGTNRSLSRVRALFNWGIRTGYLEKTPFMRGTQAVIKLATEHPRTRRLQPGEREALLNACGPYLRALVEAALATGMRRGELLSLTWSQVSGLTVTVRDGETIYTWAPKSEIVLPWSKTKTRRDRRIPIAARLRSILSNAPLRSNGYPSRGYGVCVRQRDRTTHRDYQTQLDARGVEDGRYQADLYGHDESVARIT